MRKTSLLQILTILILLSLAQASIHKLRDHFKKDKHHIDQNHDDTAAKPAAGDSKPAGGDSKPAAGDSKPAAGDAKPTETKPEVSVGSDKQREQYADIGCLDQQILNCNSKFTHDDFAKKDYYVQKFSALGDKPKYQDVLDIFEDAPANEQLSKAALYCIYTNVHLCERDK